MIDPASVLKEAAGLMEVEWNAIFNALHLGDNDPSIVAESHAFSGLSAAGDTLDLVVVLLQILFNMDFLQHRLVDDFLVTYRKIQKDGETSVCLVLVFAGAADVDILISVAPVLWESFIEPLRALGDKIKLQIRADLHHHPGFGTPCIGVRMKEVRGEAGHDCAVLRLQLIASMPVFFDRKVERGCLLHDGGIPAKFGITPVYIAVLTSGTAFGAAVPWIPEWHMRLLSLRRSRFLAGTIVLRSGDRNRRAGSPHRHSDIAFRVHIDKAFSDPRSGPPRLCSGKARRTSGPPVGCLAFRPSCITSPYNSA